MGYALQGPGEEEKVLRVLILSYDDVERNAYKHILRKHGYEVVPCANGDQAMSALRTAYGQKNPFDLYLLRNDIPYAGNIPQMSAIDFLEELDALKLDGSTRALILGDTDDKDLQARLENIPNPGKIVPGGFICFRLPEMVAEVMRELK